MAKGKGKGSGGSVDFKVTASGLNKVDKDAKKAGKSFNQLDKNARSADRAGKGVANMSSNVTKNFSKMSQGITGGLVPAYATLAAQLFALDALFRFLREAADFRVLQEGQEAFAGVTGRAMKSLAKDIQAATQAQITFKEASQAAAIGLAAGLSPTQLNELGAAAKTVSIALGRDTTDSFNRLVRGVTKAEPELLDELGIILRLDEATTRYAASLGLNKNQLTTFQKSQAVANDVLRQSEERYGAINELLGADSVNALNQLMVAFDEVMNRFRTVIGPIAEFFGRFLVDNIESATAAIGVFVASISRSLLAGALPNLGNEAVKAATGIAGSGDLQESKMMSKKRISRLSSGTGTKADIAAYQKAVTAKESIMIKFERHTRAEHAKTVKILRAQNARMVADATTGFERMKMEWKADLYEMQAIHGQFVGSVKMGGVAIGRAMSGLLRFAGYIGIAVMIFQMAKGLFDRFFGDDNKKMIEEFEAKTQDYTQAQRDFNDEISKTVLISEAGLLGNVGQEIEQVGNAFQSADLPAKLFKLDAMSRLLGEDNEKVQDFNASIFGTISLLGRLDPTFKTMVDNQLAEGKTLTEIIPMIQETTTLRTRQGQAVKALNNAQANTTKQINALIQALPKIPFQEVIKSIEEEERALKQLTLEFELGTISVEEYEIQLEIAEARLVKFRTIQEQTIKTQKALNRAMIEAERSKFGMFGDAKRTANALKFAQGMEKLLKASTNVLTAENNVALSKAQGTNVKQAEQQLDLAKQLMDLEMQRLTNLKYQSSEIMMAYKDLFGTLEKDLGTAFGKVLRGEAGAFKDFGKNLAKQLTDALGKNIAEFQLKLMFGGTPLDPDHQRQMLHEQLKMDFASGALDFENAGINSANHIEGGMIRAANEHVRMLNAAERAGLVEAKATATQRRVRTGQAVEENKEDLNAVATAEARIENARFLTGNDGQNMGGQNQIDGIKFSITKLQEQILTNIDIMNKNDRNRYDDPDAISLADIENPKLTKANTGLKQQIEELTTKVKTLEGALEKAEKDVTDAGTILQNANIKQAMAERTTTELTIAHEDAKVAEESATTALTNFDTAVTAATSGVTDFTANLEAEDSPGMVELTRAERRAEALKNRYPHLMNEGEGKGAGNQMTKNFAEFGTVTAEFGGFVAMGMSMAGESEKAAKLMQKVAMLQMAIMIAEKAAAFGKGFAADGFMGGIKNMMGFRYGGMAQGGRYGAGTGGIFDGPESGYNVKMHGNEAVVPLGNDRSIPVKMSGSGGTNNVHVSVNVDQNGNAETLLSGDGARELGRTIATIATDTIAKEQRAGGLLSSI